MPLVSRVYSFVATFISSMIVPTSDTSISNVVGIGFLFKKIGETLMNGFYSVCKWFLAFMDFLQYFIQKLIGLDYWLDTSLDGNRSLGEATSEDMIFKFLYADSVQKVFRALIALFIVLLIVFTIFQIIKSEWDFMTGDGKNGNSKNAIFRSSFKAILIVIVFPILLVMGIVSSNAILASIIKAVGVDMAETFGGKIFSIAAQPANKYRHYVDKGAYLPTSDQVTFYLDDSNKVIYFGDAENSNQFRKYYPKYKDYLTYTSKARKLTINSIFDPLIPKNEEEFSGYCFKVKDDDGIEKIYFVKAESAEKDKYYYYLVGCLGANVYGDGVNDGAFIDGLDRDVVEALEEDVGGSTKGLGYVQNLNLAEARSKTRSLCRNSWNYSLIYISPNKKLSQTLAGTGNQSLNDFGLGSSGVGMILHNSEHISAYFDGGQFGVVQSRAEYQVMADVVDFMCDNNLTFYIMDATSSLINWNYNGYHIDSSLKSSSVVTLHADDASTPDVDESFKALTFLTNYSNNNTLPAENEQEVIYIARQGAQSELDGARYIVCLSDGATYYPLVNGKEFKVGDREYVFSSSTYDKNYNGVVWAKGTFDTRTVDASRGNPTYLKNTSTFSGETETVADSDGSYFYRFENNSIKFYTHYTQVVSGAPYAFNPSGSGNLYYGTPTGVSANFDNKTITANSMTYNLQKTGRVINGRAEYATEKSGICFVVYDNNGTFQQMDSSGNLSAVGSGLRASYLTSAGAKVLGTDLAIKTVSFTTLHYGDDADNTLKSAFSVFDKTGPANDPVYDYLGSFTKTSVDKTVGSLSDIKNYTKSFKPNWGGEYYNLDIVGKADSVDKIKEKFGAMTIADSVSCCRNQIETFSGSSLFNYIIEINIKLFKGIWEVKTGCVQQVSDTASIQPGNTFSFAGAGSGITFDYFFDQNVSLKTFYAASKINYVILLVSSILIIKVLFTSLWGVIKRFYMITLYYLAMPVAASTMPIDGGSRFGNIRNQIIQEVLSTYGVLIGLNLFFVLLSPIDEISRTIFTDEAIANSGSYFLIKLSSWLSARVLNELVYILFLLVAFTLINELPQFVSNLSGGKDLKASGEQTKGAAKGALSQAKNVVNGGFIKDMYGEAKKTVPFVQGAENVVKGGVKFVGDMGKKFAEGHKGEMDKDKKGAGGEGKDGGEGQDGEKKNKRQGEGDEPELDENGNPIEMENARQSGEGEVDENGNPLGDDAEQAEQPEWMENANSIDGLDEEAYEALSDEEKEQYDQAHDSFIDKVVSEGKEILNPEQFAKLSAKQQNQYARNRAKEERFAKQRAKFLGYEYDKETGTYTAKNDKAIKAEEKIEDIDKELGQLELAMIQGGDDVDKEKIAERIDQLQQEKQEQEQIAAENTSQKTDEEVNQELKEMGVTQEQKGLGMTFTQNGKKISKLRLMKDGAGKAKAEKRNKIARAKAEFANLDYNAETGTYTNKETGEEIDEANVNKYLDTYGVKVGKFSGKVRAKAFHFTAAARMKNGGIDEVKSKKDKNRKFSFNMQTGEFENDRGESLGTSLSRAHVKNAGKRIDRGAGHLARETGKVVAANGAKLAKWIGDQEIGGMSISNRVLLAKAGVTNKYNEHLSKRKAKFMGYKYDSKTGKYINSKGKKISEEKLNEELNAMGVSQNKLGLFNQHGKFVRAGKTFGVFGGKNAAERAQDRNDLAGQRAKFFGYKYDKADGTYKKYDKDGNVTETKTEEQMNQDMKNKGIRQRKFFKKGNMSGRGIGFHKNFENMTEVNKFQMDAKMRAERSILGLVGLTYDTSSGLVMTRKMADKRAEEGAGTSGRLRGLLAKNPALQNKMTAISVDKEERKTLRSKRLALKQARQERIEADEVVWKKENAQREARKGKKKNDKEIGSIDAELSKLESDFAINPDTAKYNRINELKSRKAKLTAENKAHEQTIADNEVTAADKQAVRDAVRKENQAKGDKADFVQKIKARKEQSHGETDRVRPVSATLAKVGKGLKTTALVAGAVAMSATPLGIVGTGLVYGTAYLAQNTVKQGIKFVKADNETRLRMAKHFGGNVLKVAAVAGVGFVSGAPMAAVAGANILAWDKLRAIKGRKAALAAVNAGLATGGSATAAAAATPQSVSVTAPQTVQQTQNSFVYDESKIAEIVRKVLRGEGMFTSPEERQQAAAHSVNYAAINDEAFVTNKANAYRNTVVNSITGSRGAGSNIVGNVINNYAQNARVNINDVLFRGYTDAEGNNNAGLISASAKLALYKTMMTSEQLDNINERARKGESVEDILKFIEGDKNTGKGLGLQIQAQYVAGKGISFEYIDQMGKRSQIQGKGAKDAAVGDALREAMTSDRITDDAVVESIIKTGNTSRVETAIARNYALTIDYAKETIGNTSGSLYHQDVLERAAKDEDINAEAIYRYLQNNSEKFEVFKQDFHITGDEPEAEQLILESIKSSVRNKSGIVGKLNPTAYGKELSEVVSRRVANNSFKVEAFELLEKQDQVELTDHISANLEAASTGAEYAYTPSERATRVAMAEGLMGDAETVHAFLNSNIENKDEIINQLALSQLGIESAGSLAGQRMLEKIGKTKVAKLTQEGHTEEEILVAYAKASIFGQEKNFEQFINDNSRNRELVETLMRGEKVTEVSQEEIETFEGYKKVSAEALEAQAQADAIKFKIDNARATGDKSVNIEHLTEIHADAQAQATALASQRDAMFTGSNIKSNGAYIMREQELLAQFRAEVLANGSSQQALDAFRQKGSEYERFAAERFRDAKVDINNVGKMDAKQLTSKLRGATDRYSSTLGGGKQYVSAAQAHLSNTAFVENVLAQNPGNITVNQMVMDTLGMRGSDGKIDVKSEAYLRLIAEMQQNNFWKANVASIKDAGSEDAQRLVLAYAKAKILGEENEAKAGSFTGKSADSRNADVARRIAEMSAGASDGRAPVVGQASSESARLAINNLKISYLGGDAPMASLATILTKDPERTNTIINQMVLDSIGVKGADGQIDVKSEAYLSMIQEIKQNGAWGKRLSGIKDYGSGDAQKIVLGYAKAKILGEHTTDSSAGFIGANADSRNADVARKIEEFSTRPSDGKSPIVGEISAESAKLAVNNVRFGYLNGDGKVSRLNAEVQGYYRASSVLDFLRGRVSESEISQIRRDGAENGFYTLSIAEQNALLAKMAARDEGARRILSSNNVDINSTMQVSNFLNSEAGNALRERLISKVSHEMTALDMFAEKLGVGSAGVHSLVYKRNADAERASLQERYQGELVSLERVKEEVIAGQSTAAAESISNNAVDRIKVLTEEEEIYYAARKKKSKVSKIDEVEAELAKDESYQSLTRVEQIERIVQKLKADGIITDKDKLAAERRQVNAEAMAGNGFERMAAVTSAVWDNAEMKNNARTLFGQLYKGQGDLSNISEVDRNSFIMQNISRILAMSKGKAYFESIYGVKGDPKKKGSFGEVELKSEENATSSTIISNMSQEQFNTVIKGMKLEGDKVVSEVRGKIIANAGKVETFTEMPDPSKMTATELKEFNAAKSALEQHYRKNNNAEEFVNLYRNTTLVNEESTLTWLLSQINSNIAEARRSVLRNNADYMGAIRDSMLGTDTFAKMLAEIKSHLKAEGVDYDKLSNREKDEYIRSLLSSEAFLDKNVESKKLLQQFNKEVETELVKRSGTATNFEVKQGLSDEMISKMLASDAATREQLMRIGAHRPEHMFRREHFHQTRIFYMLRNPMMRERFMKAIMRHLYREPELKKMIEADHSLYDSKIKKMTKAEASKYLNEHFDELLKKLAEKMLLERDKKGNYTLNQTVNQTVANRVIDDIEYKESKVSTSFRKTLADAVKVMLGGNSKRNEDIDEILNKLMGKFETSSEFKKVVKEVVKPTMREQFQTYLNGAEWENIITRAKKDLRTDTQFAMDIFAKANAATSSEIAALNKRLNDLRKRLK